MIFKESYIHDLAILRLKVEDISGFSNEQLYLEYRKIFKELVAADRKYDKEHPDERKGVKIGSF